MSLLVKNVHLVDPSQNLDGPGALLIAEGKVVAIGAEAVKHPQAAGADVVDGGGAVGGLTLDISGAKATTLRTDG